MQVRVSRPFRSGIVWSPPSTAGRWDWSGDQPVSPCFSLSDLRAPEGSLCGSMIFMSSWIISEVWCHDPVLPSGKASAEQLTAKVYHLAGCATMADPTRTSGSFSPVSCRCLLSSWLRPHWGISQEKLPLDPGFFQFVYNIPRRGKALLGRW